MQDSCEVEIFDPSDTELKTLLGDLSLLYAANN